MSITRRTLLAGAGSGAVAVLLAACRPEPDPTPAPTTPSPTPTSGVPRPAAFARSSWSSDPFARGGVSFTAVGSLPSDRELLGRPVAERVFFAGEATSAERPGTMTGAWRSGVRVAGDVAEVAAAGERIAVVGAGLAGVEAARRLADEGFDVIVIEARDRLGGRVHSAESDAWPIPVQFGGWRLSADDDEFAARLAVSGVATIGLPEESYLAVRDGAESDVAPVGPEAIDRAVTWAADQARDVPLAVALEESGAAEAAAGAGDAFDGAELLDQYLATLVSHAGGAIDDLSSWYPPSAPATGSGIVGDLDAALADRLDGIGLSRSTSLVGVAYGDDGVSLRLGTGESLSVDRVVLTVPLGVLQADDIEFQPRLPFEHRSAIAALGVGPLETLWLRFDEPFWRNDASVWHVVGGDVDLRTWYNLEPSTGEPLLVAVVGGETAGRLAELDDDALVQRAVDALAAFAD